MTVRVRVYGGLGNQMFQYAAGRAVADRTGQRLVLDVSWYFRTPAGATAWPYQLNVFNVDARLVDYDARHRRALRKALRLGQEAPVLGDLPSAHFNPEVIATTGSVVLDGYFQSELYFRDRAERIRRDLRFRNAPDHRNQTALQQISKGRASVSAHVRRGDYVVKEEANAFHGLVSLDYYAAAGELIRQQTGGNVEFWVFSDDPSWCRESLTLPGPMHFVDWNTGNQSFEDLRLMSACRHHVIANSSFSWWGAWLNSSPDKIVTAPKRWFAASDADRDRFPSDWLLLE